MTVGSVQDAASTTWQLLCKDEAFPSFSTPKQNPQEKFTVDHLEDQLLRFFQMTRFIKKEGSVHRKQFGNLCWYLSEILKRGFTGQWKRIDLNPGQLELFKEIFTDLSQFLHRRKDAERIPWGQLSDFAIKEINTAIRPAGRREENVVHYYFTRTIGRLLSSTQPEEKEWRKKTKLEPPKILLTDPSGKTSEIAFCILLGRKTLDTISQ